jgi:hypothetical protein
MEEPMSTSNAQRVEPSESAQPETSVTKRPIATVRVENVEGAIWPNPGEKGTFYNVTFSRKYEDKEGKLQNTHSFGPADLLALPLAASEAYKKIQELRQKDRGR